MTTISTQVTVSQQRPIITWRNGNWGGMPHANYFKNMLRAHVKKINGYKKKQVEERSIQQQLNTGVAVLVNGLYFRFKHEKKGQAHEVTQSTKAA